MLTNTQIMRWMLSYDSPTMERWRETDDTLDPDIRDDIRRNYDIATNYGRRKINQSLREEIIEEIVAYWMDKITNESRTPWKKEGF